jgi:hypothetical protein
MFRAPFGALFFADKLGDNTPTAQAGTLVVIENVNFSTSLEATQILAGLTRK